ncbi:PTS sugar transporter subunit IIA [Cellulomonas triticagri]|uniref:PTS sugar transporter subunit IIA n=1 Tax=Cellulomonas triticagri TaxID=2483352 RepID=UPI001F2CF0A2|nr:PTS sugar transporter subunit IIA [Cellulomonas triticagri]
MTDEIVTLDRVVLRSGTATREEATAEAVGLLVATGAVTSDYLDAVLQREQEMSTHMGNGLAVPHGTTAAKDTVLASGLAVVRYDTDVDWGGAPVRFVVAIAGRGDEHLHMLARIAVLFSDTSTVERLQAAPTARDLHALLVAAEA